VAGVTYLAAWLALIEYAQVGAGETLLVIGANGGVAARSHRSANGKAHE